MGWFWKHSLSALEHFLNAPFFVSDLIISQCGISHWLLFVLVIPEKSVKEVVRAPGTIKDRIKKLLAHKNSMKKKVTIKNVITEPAGTPSPKVNLRPFDSEESISRDASSGGEKKGTWRKKEHGAGGREKRQGSPEEPCGTGAKPSRRCVLWVSLLLFYTFYEKWIVISPGKWKKKTLSCLK